MTRHILIAGAAALALCACHNRATEPKGAASVAEQRATPDANPSATLLTPANETAAPGFVAAAANSDRFEVEASQLASTRSHNPQVKAFARMMITAHEATTRALQAAIHTSGANVTPPAELPQDLRTSLDHLRQASDADFDSAYLAAQVDAHQNALNVMQHYAQSGDVAAIRTFAAQTAPHVEEHLIRARELRTALDQPHDRQAHNARPAHNG